MSLFVFDADPVLARYGNLRDRLHYSLRSVCSPTPIEEQWELNNKSGQDQEFRLIETQGQHIVQVTASAGTSVYVVPRTPGTNLFLFEIDGMWYLRALEYQPLFDQEPEPTPTPTPEASPTPSSTPTPTPEPAPPVGEK